MKTNFKAMLVLGVAGMLAQAGIARAAGPEQDVASAGRAPASVAVPSADWAGRLGADPLRTFRVPMLSEPKSPMRWRLMGTCRQDIGMSQSVSGVGYGNCSGQ